MNADAILDVSLEAVARGIPMRVRARGTSMDSAIPDGTVVKLERRTRPISLGDVVARRGDDGSFFIHRVIGRRADGWVLVGGDNTSTPDGWFHVDDLNIVVVHFIALDGSERLIPKPKPPREISFVRQVVTVLMRRLA